MEQEIKKYDLDTLGRPALLTFYSFRKIAKILNCSVTQIKPIIKQHDLDIKYPGYVKKLDISIIRHLLYAKQIFIQED